MARKQKSSPESAGAPNATAQSAGDRVPQVTMNTGFPRREFKPGTVSQPDFRDSGRIDSLIREGKLYLSLQVP
jgi:hypothetical protein